MFEHYIEPFLNKAVPNLALSVVKIALLIGGYYVFRMLLRGIAGRILRPALVRIEERHDARVARIKALQTMLSSTFDFILGFIALVMLLQIFGLNIVPLITTAGVAGLAVGFGAQKLVRDVISGFFIVIEDQYGVGDYVSVGAVAGTVEALGMRTTSIRDVQGRLTVMSNGIIDQVCNHSRGDYRLTLEYAVSVEMQPDDVRKALESAVEDVKVSLSDIVFGAKVCEGFAAISGASRIYRIEIITLPTFLDMVKCKVNGLVNEALDRRGIRLV